MANPTGVPCDYCSSQDPNENPATPDHQLNNAIKDSDKGNLCLGHLRDLVKAGKLSYDVANDYFVYPSSKVAGQTYVDDWDIIFANYL